MVCALHGLKSSGAVWCSHFAGRLRDIGFIPKYMDLDMCHWETATPEGFKYIRISKGPTKIIHSFADPPFLYHIKNVGPSKSWAQK